MSSRLAPARSLALVSSIAALAFAGQASAHADHYGQSAFVTVGPSEVKVELDLSPGFLVASQVVRLIDADGDGRLSPGEQQAYSNAVLRDLALQVDDQPLSLKVTSIDVPPVDHLATGEDRMTLMFTAAPPELLPGAHRLSLRNTHAPVRSAHQAHALVGAGAVTIGRLTRDATQEELVVDFQVAAAPAPKTGLAWSPMIGALAVAVAVGVVLRRRRAAMA